MKTAILFFSAIILSLSGISQTIHLKGALIVLPNSTELLNKEQQTNCINNQFNNDELARQLIVLNSDSGHLYKVNNMLFALHTTRASFENNYLLKEKKGLDGMSHNSKHYTSIIKTAGNNAVLITNFTIRNIDYYGFYCINANNNIVLTGSYEFPENDEAKARTLIDNMIKSIVFVN